MSFQSHIDELVWYEELNEPLEDLRLNEVDLEDELDSSFELLVAQATTDNSLSSMEIPSIQRKVVYILSMVRLLKSELKRKRLTLLRKIAILSMDTVQRSSITEDLKDSLKEANWELQLLRHLTLAIRVFEAKVIRTKKGGCQNKCSLEQQDTLSKPRSDALAARRQRNRNTVVMSNENDSGFMISTPIILQHKRKIDEPDSESEDSTLIHRIKRKKFKTQGETSNEKSLMVSNDINIYKDIHLNHSSVKFLKEADLYNFQRMRAQEAKLFNMYNSNPQLYEIKTKTLKALFDYNSFRATNFRPNQFISTKTLNLTLSKGATFNISKSKKFLPPGFNLYYSLLSAFNKDSLCPFPYTYEKFMRLLSVKFSISSTNETSPKFMHGKVQCNFGFHKVWLFNNLNFAQEIISDIENLSNEIRQDLDHSVETLSPHTTNELRFNIKVLNFEDLGFEDYTPCIDGAQENIAQWLEGKMLFNNHTLHKIPDLSTYSNLLELLMFNNIVDKEKNFAFMRDRHIARWLELPPYCNHSFESFSEVAMCVNCLKYVQEHFVLMEWSLVDIDDKLANLSKCEKESSFNEDQYFANSLFLNNPVFNPEGKFDYNNLLKLHKLTRDEFISQMSKIKLLVSMNKHTGETHLVKFKKFDKNPLASHLMEEYTTVFNKIICFQQTPSSCESFEIC